MSTLSDEMDKRPLSWDEYDLLIEKGVLTREDHVEFRDGRLLPVSPMGPTHSNLVDDLGKFLQYWILANNLDDEVRLGLGTPIKLNKWEPHPDFTLRKPYSEKRKARAEDVFFLIQISDSTLEKDTNDTKRYAKNKVPEVWIVNVQNENAPEVIVFRGLEKGIYTDVKHHKIEPSNKLTSTQPDGGPAIPAIQVDHLVRPLKTLKEVVAAYPNNPDLLNLISARHK